MNSKSSSTRMKPSSGCRKTDLGFLAWPPASRV
ncbi:hypothetical protein J1605_011643 [Eschrichtius robustus]|uniref:Uncharacterized protein n=1 Tax=Eschrichtius robustus TaxID=9764 RepID=A0AB34GPK9_ESCRO|nr:hypothetical protein J1605_011643 [Eschrichtius robustus]